MPTGPKGEKRPADVIGNAVKVMRIATARSWRTAARKRPKTRYYVVLGYCGDGAPGDRQGAGGASPPR